MSRFWTRSLAGQIVGLLVLALALSYAIGCLVYVYERSRLMQGAARDEFLDRAAATAHLLESTPPQYHEEILRTAGTSLNRFWLTSDDPSDAVSWQDAARLRLSHALLSDKAPNPALGRLTLPTLADATWEALPADEWPLGRAARIVELPDSWNGFGLAVRLDDGRWLCAASAKTTALLSRLQSYISVAVTALTISLVAFFVAGRVARPLRDLASAAERFGRGEDVGPLELRGTRDVRRTSEAFNLMRERLRRFVEDRTRMIAAASHDLRTPITSLRLQAEFVADPAVRERMLATLEEMSATTEAVLTFAREEAVTEPSRVVDLSALLESLCDDVADIGWDVTFESRAALGEDERLPYSCRPAAIRRGLCNVIENAVRYGERARVTLEPSGEWLDVVVEDDGPGILADDVERVFEPFARLDSSRNRDTGGIGMGLAIARSVVRGHGGEILLANRSTGAGLRATIRLPRD